MKSFRISNVLFSVILAFLLFNSSAARENIVFQIEYLSTENGLSSLENSIIKTLTEKLQAKGYERGDKPEWKIILNIAQLDKDNSGKIIIACTLSETLPKPIIDFGTENEVFYLAAGKKKEKGQNKEIREYMTSGYLYQFSMIMDNKIYVAEQEDINSKLDEIVENMEENIKRFSCVDSK
jgi:hypothetical protein